MNREIYLDNSATTRPFDEIIEYMNNVNRNTYGNPSSLHMKGIEAERLIKESRDYIAASLNSDNKEIFFTSGGTESNNLAILSYLNANPRNGKHIITSQIEHPSVLEVFKYLSSIGYKIDYISVDKNGIVDLESLTAAISNDTSLISIMYVNNESGSIQPIEDIVKIKNSINKLAAIHVDAVQAYGKIRIHPKKVGIDMLSLSSHKIHGPKGVGALYVNRNTKIKSIIYGGGQESLLRSGTENVAGICGLGLASEIAFNNINENHDKVAELKSLFIESMKQNIEAYKIISPENSSPYILNIAFAGLKSEVLLHHLEEKNIFVSAGSACSSRKNVHSHVLKAMGVSSSEIDGAIRFSFSVNNQIDDVVDTVEALKEIVPKIKIKKSYKI